jgi:non-heme Fe2+,alpha-ketoglutarate-dependent halogenase
MQDAYYWPLTPSKCVTVWVAIDDIDEDNGPMQFVPGSHLHGPIHHNPSDPDEHNVLNLTVPEPGSWGDGSVTTISPLRAGQASLHSDLLLHSSDANSSSRRRCGVALTYHTTDVRLNNPDARAAMEGRSFVCRGVDVDGYWPQDVAPPTFDDIPQWDGRAPVWDAPMPAKM